MDGNSLANAVAGAFIAFGIVVAATTAALIFGIPWLWSLVKPLLHTLTA